MSRRRLEFVVRASRLHRCRRDARTTRARRGITLAEAAVSMVIVGVMLVAALQAVAASRTGLAKLGDRGQAAMLAQDLMAEILLCAYVEPDDPLAPLGVDLLEMDGSRTAFDDVDDYHNWLDVPPKTKIGTALVNGAGWGRSVEVDFVEAADLAAISLVETGVKRITVRVRRNNVETLSLVAVRTSAGSIEGGGLPPTANPAALNAAVNLN